MARLLLIVKILPTGTDVDLDEVVNSIKQNLTDRIELKQYQKEPLAFGLAVSYTHLTLPTKA